MQLSGRNASILLVAVVILGSAGIWFYQDSISRVDETSLRIYADPMTENILNSIETENYEAFLLNMDPTMKAAFTQEEFTKLHNRLHDALGHYGSKVYVSASRSGDYISVYYKAVYSKDPTSVTVKVVFTVNTGGPAVVSGLWFNSPNLAS